MCLTSGKPIAYCLHTAYWIYTGSSNARWYWDNASLRVAGPVITRSVPGRLVLCYGRIGSLRPFTCLDPAEDFIRNPADRAATKPDRLREGGVVKTAIWIDVVVDRRTTQARGLGHLPHPQNGAVRGRGVHGGGSQRRGLCRAA